MVGYRMNKKPLTEFFRDEVRDFSIYSCERNIASGVDGMKPSQRKVIFGMQKKFNNQEVKVSIASAGVMEISAYHHGSLDGVIVNMAQNFPGANNTPLLDAIGQFGSRISPEASATRYIFTQLSDNFRKLFKTVDNNILEYNEDDGILVEPKYYLPVLPTLLLNGSEGMGTGFASSVMAYNPADIKMNILDILKGRTPVPLIPWYRGFTGNIERDGDQAIITGVITVVNTTTLEITELPIGSYTTKYRDTLNSLEDRGIVKSYVDESDEESTKFTVKVSREIAAQDTEKLLQTFKLVKRETENITVWTDEFKIRKFDNVNDYLKWFVSFRVGRYDDRKEYILRSLSAEKDKMDEEIRFIKLYLKRSKVWSEALNKDIISELEAAKFTRIDELLSIRVSRLTGEAIEKMQKQIAEIKSEIEILLKKTAQDLYEEDLNECKL
jgi:DNA topoisomerase-2